MTHAERFFLLFHGLARAHGRYTVAPATSSSGVAGATVKVDGRAVTYRDPPTPELWEAHLAGDAGIGIIPVKDDKTAGFGAIDIDQYPLELERLAAEVKALGLPLTVCRTKSGGAHLYLFCREGVSAALVQGKLMEWAVALGYAGVEVFPKQTVLTDHDAGNWINMPYQAGTRTLRYALDDAGQPLSIEAFLDRAESMRVTSAELALIEPPADQKIGDMLLEAPPCLQCLGRTGVPPGTRNNAIFNYAVYMRKRYGEGWEEHLDEVNTRLMTPPLGSAEVQITVKQVKKKTYNYRCHEQPIVSVCNKQICLTRKFGVGGSNDDPGVVFGPLIKVDFEPPLWIWQVDGARIEVSTEVLLDQGRFERACLDKLNKLMQPVKPMKWRQIITDHLAKVEVQTVPEDARLEGQYKEYLRRFCTGQARALEPDGIGRGLAYLDKETGRHWFRSADFMQYLSHNRVQGVTERALWRWIRNAMGGESGPKKIKGVVYTLWMVPQFPIQEEPYDVPSHKPEF